MPLSRTSLTQSPRARRLLGLVAAVVLGLTGGWIGLMLGGTVNHEVGPLDTSMQVLPDWGGNTTVSIPPLGELVLDTHDGPLGVHARLVGVDVDEARAIMQDPQQLEGMRDQAEGDLRWELMMAAGRSVLSAVLGAAALSALALRRVRSTLVGGATAGLAMATAAAVAFTTWNPSAMAEPRYTGLLASAPSVVGNADRIVNDFSAYGDQLAKLVENVTGLYAATSQLPILKNDHDVVRVLHVSDLHLAPQAWDVIRTVEQKYDVDVIVDSGDITDHGSKPENRYLQEIRHLRAPYVWVRGNHDSVVTERAMRQMKNVVVLEGKVRKIAGLTFLGAGDPTFTPDKSVALSEDAQAGYVEAAARDLATTAEEAGGVDVAVFHDPTPMEALDGLASVSLSGHLHYRKVTHGEQGTWLMTEGSTGGSGLRALEPEKGPAPIQLSVLYLDRDSGDLLAYDDIKLGGLGLASAEIDRQVVANRSTTEQVAPAPNGSSEEPSADASDDPSDQPSDEPSEPASRPRKDRSN